MESSIKKYRLPKDFAVKWLEALRSDKYQQTKEMLYRAVVDKHNTTGYCCLGVAGAICGYTNDEMQEVCELSDILMDYDSDELTDLYYDRPTEFMMPLELIKISTGSLANKCINMNDSEGKSFSQIADWLEENVEFY